MLARSLLGSVANAYGQNLVPNPSFENFDTCPLYTAQFYRCDIWENPTSNTPDYFNECWNEGWYDSPDVPINRFGSEPARTGQAYAGLYCQYSGVNGREYISVKLNDTLVAGSRYCVEFFVTLGDSTWGGINYMGAHFSAVPDTMSDYYFNLPFQPQIEDTTVITDTTGWVKISGTFIAQGGETYMTIGVFKPDSMLTYDSIQGDGSVRYTYYFIDDVAVWNCDTATPTYPNFTLFPNPSNGEFYISGNFPEATHLLIYNMLGQKIGESIALPTGHNLFSINLELAQGVYYYEIVSPTEQLTEGKFVILKY